MNVAQSYRVRWITRNTIRLKYVLSVSMRIIDKLGLDLVGEKIEAIGCNDFLHLATDQRAELCQIIINRMFYR